MAEVRARDTAPVGTSRTRVELHLARLKLLGLYEQRVAVLDTLWSGKSRVSRAQRPAATAMVAVHVCSVPSRCWPACCASGASYSEGCAARPSCSVFTPVLSAIRVIALLTCSLR